MYKIQRQQGGTVIGIIIGLVIGLGIALAVAMAITKTPMPFTDKSGKVKLTEPTAGQSADPNKPLYGNKTASKEAAKEFAKEAAPPENTAAPQPDKKPEVVKVDPKADAKADAKQQDAKAPVVEQSAAAAKKPDTVEAKADKADGQDDKWSYFLQAGAFRDQSDAEGMRAKLALMGVEAKVSERQADTGTLYRVRVGPFGQLEAMNKVRGKLSDNGVDAAVVRMAK